MKIKSHLMNGATIGKKGKRPGIAFLFILFSFFAFAQGDAGKIYLVVQKGFEDSVPTFDTLLDVTVPTVISGTSFDQFEIIKIERSFARFNLGSHFERFYTLYYQDTLMGDSLVNELLRISFVIGANKPIMGTFFHTPDDPYFQGQQWNLSKVKAPEAWDIWRRTGNEDVFIAIVDDAIDIDHKDLRDALYTNPGETGLDASGNDKASNGIDDDNNGFIDDVHGWDVADNDADVRPPGGLAPDVLDHGTGVTGNACAVTDNGQGIASISTGLKFLPVKINPDNGAFDIMLAIDGVAYAIQMGAKVINCSWGVDADHPTIREEFIEFQKLAEERNFIIVAAAGNTPANMHNYPASYPGIISVAGTDINDEKSSGTYGSTYNDQIDICAPGINIYTTSKNDQYKQINEGTTSQAAPQVSSLLAAMYVINPNRTHTETVGCLLESADDIYPVNDPSLAGLLGAGRINAERSFQCMASSQKYTVDFSSNFQTVCVTSQPVYFHVYETNMPAEGLNYVWNFEDGNPAISMLKQPGDIKFNSTGPKKITLTISYSSGGIIRKIEKKDYINVVQAGNYSYSPKIDNTWLFGKNTGMDFNVQYGPINDLNHNSDHEEGYASISNYDGQLLFYTDGQYLYNRLHQRMNYLNSNTPAEIGPNSDNSNTQVGIIIPDNISTCGLAAARYYVFFLTPPDNELKYLAVDLNRNNGLGAVIGNQQNSPFVFSAGLHGEKITAIPTCDKSRFWLLVHEGGNNNFHARLIDFNNRNADGSLFINVSMVSSVGNPHIDGHGGERGQMKISPDGKKVIVVGIKDNFTELFDFNLSTGTVSNPVPLQTNFSGGSPVTFGGSYGAEFSPNGRYLYTTCYNTEYNNYGILQYDLTNMSQPPVSISNIGPLTAMELGPDGKIYMPVWQTEYMAVINDPNLPGQACNFNFYGFKLSDSVAFGINNTFHSKYLQSIQHEAGAQDLVQYLCPGSSITLSHTLATGYTDLFWYDKDGNLLAAGNPNYVVYGPGLYTFTFKDPQGCTKTITYTIKPTPGNNTTITKCVDRLPYELIAEEGGIDYSWSNGGTGRTLAITSPGQNTVSVQITFANGCTQTVTYVVNATDFHEQTIILKCGDALNLYNYGPSLTIDPMPWVLETGPNPGPVPSNDSYIMTSDARFRMRDGLGTFPNCPGLAAYELILNVKVLQPEKEITVDAYCGETIDLEALSGCGGAGSYYWAAETQYPVGFNGTMVVTGDMVYKRTTTEGDCDCNVRVKVNIKNSQLQIITLDNGNSCFGRTKSFGTNCPKGDFVDRWELISPSGAKVVKYPPLQQPNGPIFHNPVYEQGDYLLITHYTAGCPPCTTIYRSTIDLISPIQSTTKVYYCGENTRFAPPLNCNAPYTSFALMAMEEGESWTDVLKFYFVHNRYPLIDEFGTYSWRIDLSDIIELKNFRPLATKFVRVTLDGPLGASCIKCIEVFEIGDETTLTKPELTIEHTVELCESQQCVEFNPKDYFPDYNLICQNPIMVPGVSFDPATNKYKFCKSSIGPSGGISFVTGCTDLYQGCPLKIIFKIVDRPGCKSGGTIDVNAETNPQSVTIYPNPNQGHFTLKIENEDLEDVVKEIVITDLTGKRIFSASYLENTIDIDLSDISSGVYLVHVKFTQGTFTGKIEILK